MENMQCKICGNLNDNKAYTVREMMFGLREKFTYFQCSNCSCLQIAEIPADMSKYYPADYYSFSPQSSKNPLKSFIKNSRNRYAVLNKGILGRLICVLLPNENLHFLAQFNLTENSSILDVGCGSGVLLHDLRDIGFNNLLGVDPFIEKDIEYGNGLKILKKSIHEIDGKYDLIMFHHSFEHLADPIETLLSVTKLLNKNGVCLIRIPTVSSYAWEHYRGNWVQLDAPRHFFLHSVKSIGLLAGMSSLNLEKTIYDSTDFQFWGSEQYVKDIPLMDSRSYLKNPSGSIFSKEEISEFKKKAKELNSKNLGDACAFILRKV